MTKRYDPMEKPSIAIVEACFALGTLFLMLIFFRIAPAILRIHLFHPPPEVPLLWGSLALAVLTLGVCIAVSLLWTVTMISLAAVAATMALWLITTLGVKIRDLAGYNDNVDADLSDVLPPRFWS